MSNALIGYGLTVQMATVAAPTVFTTLDEIFDFTPPADKFDDVDVTHYLSAGRKRQYIVGLGDSGDYSLAMNYIPNSATDIYLLAARGNQRVIKISYSNGTTVTFTGNISEYGPDKVPVDGKMTAMVKGKVSGNPVFGASSAPVNSVLPAISGLLANGSTLTAFAGSWSPGAVSYTYQWRRGGVNIGGATGSTYVTVIGDVGTSISVAVTATNGTGSATATSIGTANIT